MCNTENIRRQNIKHKTLLLKGFISKLGQYLYSRAKPRGIALNYLLYYSFLASLERRPKRISMAQF